MIGPVEPWHKWYPGHVSHEVRVPHATFNEAWASRVSSAPDAPAMRYFDTVYSNRVVDEALNALAAGLRAKGVGAGDHFGIQLQNIPQFPLIQLALWRLGAIPVLLNPMYKAHELGFILGDSRPVGIVGAAGVIDELMSEVGDVAPPLVLSTRHYELPEIGDRKPGEIGRPMSGDIAENDLFWLIDAHRGEAPPPVEVTPESAALLAYTSGTTGEPKGAVMSHLSLLTSAETSCQWFGFRPDDRSLALGPFFHMSGAMAMAMWLSSGSELVFIGRPTPELFLESMEKYKIHHVAGAITAFHGLLSLPYGGPEELREVRTVVSGGAPIPYATVEQFAERYGHYIRSVYGMTETSASCVGVPLDQEAPVDQETGTLSSGVPLPGVGLRVRREDGELATTGEFGEFEVRFRGLMTEYLNQPQATAEVLSDGWLKTGDIGFMDEDGWVYAVDRKKDQINVSGYKVWPREVEDVIYAYPGVREAAVVGRPNSYSGEEVVAFVSLHTGADASPADIRSHVRSKLANFKAPREVVVLDDLPKTATGKIQRRALRD